MKHFEQMCWYNRDMHAVVNISEMLDSLEIK